MQRRNVAVGEDKTTKKREKISIDTLSLQSKSNSVSKGKQKNDEEESSDSSAVSEPVAKTSNSIDSLVSPRLTRRQSSEKSSFFNFSFGKQRRTSVICNY
jgi:hypothetical protein